MVYCVDTEGPLNESIEATFERLSYLFKVDIDPTIENYEDLKSGILGAKLGIDFSQVFNTTTLNYNRTMSELDDMLSNILSQDYRKKYLDSYGQGWIYNWFCVAHVGIKDNPRHKTIGTHVIFDKYQKLLGESDSIHFHYHPLAANLNASSSGTTWIMGNSNLVEILCKRVIDRNWFPAFSRPGFHVTRPDSHWFMEQYIPFDFSNQSLLPSNNSHPPDYKLGDWRRAPTSWVPYHPAHDDWQIPGDCKRTIARCLNVGTRHSLLTIDEVRHAFHEIKSGKQAVLAFTNHDFRDVRQDIRNVHNLLLIAHEEFPSVKFKYARPQDAFFSRLTKSKIKFDVELSGSHLRISTNKPTFGIQPFFCYKTIRNVFHFDNLQINEPYHAWSYSFSNDTTNLNEIDKVGIAANTKHGVTTVCLLDVQKNEKSESYHNVP